MINIDVASGKHHAYIPDNHKINTLYTEATKIQL